MKLEFSVYRYNPDVDDAPRMQDYTLEAEEGRDMMLWQRNTLKASLSPSRRLSVSVSRLSIRKR